MSPSRWNGRNTLSRSLRGHAGTAVDDAHVDSVAGGTGDDAHPLPGRAVVERVDDHVREGALEEARVGEHPRVSLVDVDIDLGAARADARERGRDDLVDPHRRQADVERAGLEAAHVEKVADERVEAVRLLVDRDEELVARLGRPLHVLLEEARDRGLDPRERRAEVVRDGGEDRGAQVAGGGEESRLGGLRAELLEREGGRDLPPERLEDAIVTARLDRAAPR